MRTSAARSTSVTMSVADDHDRARRLAKAAASRWPGGIDVGLVHTNIVRVAVGDPGRVLAHLRDRDVLAVPGSADTVRLVTHADIDDADLDRAVAAIESAP